MAADAGTAPVTRAQIVGAFVAGTFLAAGIILASSGGDIDRTAYGDGLIYRYVASHLDTDLADMHPVVLERGPSLRYGRIGLPWLVWLTAGGRTSATGYTHAIVISLAAGAASAATVVLFSGAGALGALLPFLAPGFALCVSGGYAEVLAVALSLWATAAAVRGRWVAASAALAAAILTKENAVVVLAGLCVLAMIRRRPRAIPILALSMVPSLAWWGVVSARFGHFGPLDPYLRETTETVGAPVVALVRSLVSPLTTRSAVMAALHVLLALVALALMKRSIFGVIAVVASLQLLQAAPFAWRYLGDAARISTFLELFVILAIVHWRRPQWADPRTALGAT